MAARLKRIALPGLTGLGCGLAIFAVESLLMLRDGAPGLNLPVQGTFAALLSVVKPQLPLLFLRVAIAYAVAGVFLGLVAAGFASLLLPADDRRRRAVLFGEMLALGGFLLWDRAIARPALLDDLPVFRPLLAWSIDHGHPWQPRLAAAFWGDAFPSRGSFRTSLLSRVLPPSASRGRPPCCPSRRIRWSFCSGWTHFARIACGRLAAPTRSRPTWRPFYAMQRCLNELTLRLPRPSPLGAACSPRVGHTGMGTDIR